MSPSGSGSPSSAVTMPTTSFGPTGAITTTCSCSGVRPNVSARDHSPGAAHPLDEIGRHREPVHLPGRDDHERDRVHRQQRSRRQHEPLHTLLSTALDEPFEVREVPELGLVHTALGADRQLRAHLRDHDADLAGRHLHPGELLHAVDRPQLEPQPGHEQLRLVAGLTFEGDRVVVAELAQPESLRDQPDFGRSDRLDREQHRQDDQHDHSQNCDSQNHSHSGLLRPAVTLCRGIPRGVRRRRAPRRRRARRGSVVCRRRSSRARCAPAPARRQPPATPRGERSSATRCRARCPRVRAPGRCPTS